MEVLSHEIAEQVSRTLGVAIARMWSRLPQDVQHDLFEETAKSLGESMRPQLAIFLHGKHSRTTASITERATIKPNSLESVSKVMKPARYAVRGA